MALLDFKVQTYQRKEFCWTLCKFISKLFVIAGQILQINFKVILAKIVMPFELIARIRNTEKKTYYQSKLTNIIFSPYSSRQISVQDFQKTPNLLLC